MEGYGGGAAGRARPEGTRYCVGVYNAMVRALVRELGDDLECDAGTNADADTNGHLGSYWAELHHEEVIAESVEQARRLASRLYPSADGFVITEVRAIDAAA
ncbi:MAG: hypothetical protein K9H25_01480 [Rhodospirillum sp.]|nr:hypothetical protein [Rhodospirillum sp.]MCF8488117.1 hypothetical protein [Rhodospirillum sp.]MCF8501290.1 hypothetical protein [Rhodospirillum sp.]